MYQKIGVSIAIGLAVGVAMTVVLAHTNLYVAIGVAMMAIVIGNGIAIRIRGSNCKHLNSASK
ncbi:MAG: hypothetical protein WCB53_04420 [Terriglobales bacterium]